MEKGRSHPTEKVLTKNQIDNWHKKRRTHIKVKTKVKFI